MKDSASPAAAPPVETPLVYAHGLAAIVTLLISVTVRHSGVDRTAGSGPGRALAVAELGPPPLRPHAGHHARLARQRVLRVSLSRRAAAHRPAGHQRAAGPMDVRTVELRGGRARLGAGAGRIQPAAGVGRIPAGDRRVRRAGAGAGDHPVPAAVFLARPRRSLRIELVHHRRAGLHAAGLPDGQLRARTGARRARRGLQRPVDSRRHRPVCHAAGARHHLFRHSRRHAPADLQPLSFDARLLAAVLSLPAERHASLRLFRHSR